MTLQSSNITPDLSASSGLSRAVGRHGLYRAMGKRLLDLTLVLVSAPVVVPLVALLALFIALDGGRPFYAQARLGQGGRVFRIWKLRSMVTDADALLTKHLEADPAARAEWDATQKLKCDPRVTRLGRILRKASLDELPQLWNVFRGEMSLVGPRPMMVSQAALYPGRAYFRLRPGITGPWQVSDRNESDFIDRVHHDDDYDRTVSFMGDLRLLWRTVAVVLRGTGC